MIPALVSHVTQNVLLCRYHVMMLARGWITRSHPQRQSSTLYSGEVPMVPHWNRLCWANHPTVTQWQPLHPDIEWLLHQVGRGSCSTIKVCTSGCWISFQVMSYVCKSAIICSKLLLCTLFLRIFMRMGLPQVLTTDQGMEFHNQLNEELMRSLGIKHHLTTAYHPQVTYAQQDSCTAFLQ